MGKTKKKTSTKSISCSCAKGKVLKISVTSPKIVRRKKNSKNPGTYSSKSKTKFKVVRGVKVPVKVINSVVAVFKDINGVAKNKSLPKEDYKDALESARADFLATRPGPRVTIKGAKK